MAYLQLIRFTNLILLVLAQATLYGGLYTPLSEWSGAAYGLFCGTAGVAGRGYMLNDWFDIATDRINRPGRPLVRGLIPASGFWILYTLLGLLTVGAALLVPALIWQSWLIADMLLLFYARYSKRLGMGANLLVAGLSGWSLLLVGALTEAFVIRLYLIAGTAMLLHLIRELVKDVEDINGDRFIKATTLPLRWGMPGALRLIRGLLLLLVVVVLGLGYWFDSLPARGLLLLMAMQSLGLWYYQGSDHSDDFSRSSTWLKILMLEGVFLALL